MDSRFNKCNPYMSEQEDATDMGGETIAESPTSATFNMDSSVTQRRRGIKKRVVQIPIKEVEGTRLKGESSNTPPSDSWAWRKYGQKPIKGSPYPRGYYKCSSSKSCPARKQVERSRVDPTMLLVTYSSDHNHPSPKPRNHHNRNSNSAAKSAKESEPDERFADLGDESMIATADELGWLGEVEAIASSAVLESPIYEEQEASMLGEEEESLFADLGELPECSVVFRRGALLEREEEQRRRCACGTTS